MFPDLEFIKTCLNAIADKFRRVKSDVDAVKSDVDSVKSSSPDWNEPDTASHSYVKNKPCYDYIEPSGVIWESDSAGTNGQSALVLVDLGDGWLIEGETYRLTVDGVETTYVCAADADGRGLYIGASYADFNNGSIFQSNTNAMLSACTSGLWNYGQKVRLEGPLRKYKKLDTSFYDAVMSVNGKTGDVQITPNNIGAATASHASDKTIHVTFNEKTTWNGKQDALSGTEGQIVGFNADGKPVAQDSGIPAGGTPGQVLMKRTNTDYDTTWGNITKLTPALTASPAKLTLDKDNLTATSTITTNSDGALSVVSDNLDIVTATIIDGVVTASLVGSVNGSATLTVTLAESAIYEGGTVTISVTVWHNNIFGVQWDGTSTTAMTRTDRAEDFTDPVPYFAGAESYSSPFDNLQPWAGMVRVTDSEAGELVAIPKFWYKFTKSGNTLKLQIADAPVDGFFVSPAHVDRGDGKGERDVVYVGRYHCASDYKSTTGQAPKTSISRGEARTNIHNLGTTVWQFDFAMRLTIQMLYMVEFADWNSQMKIGYGCGNNSAAQNVGASDSMPYHTGTMQSSRTTYGVGVQYRYIEGLWDNVYDWMDGCYNEELGLYIILNPSSFSDAKNGKIITRSQISGYPTKMSVAEAGGVKWMYPTAVGGSTTTYITDVWHLSKSTRILSCGGSYIQSLDDGLFRMFCRSSSVYGTKFGCRVQKLP